MERAVSPPTPGGGTQLSPPPRCSVLFDRPEEESTASERQAPPFFTDLNLDQILESMTAGRKEYDLEPLFLAPVRSVETVQYRHEVLRDLEQGPVFEVVRDFARRMKSMRAQLAQAQKLYFRYQKERWFLDAANTYCGAVAALARDCSRIDLSSRGLLAIREYLQSYTRSDGFAALVAATQGLLDDLAEVRYSVHIKANRVRVDTYGGEDDYSAEIERVFAKFKEGAVKDYRVKLPDWPDMNHVEGQVLELVARLYPEVFGALDKYCARYRAYLDGTIAAFDREVQFCLAYLEYIEQFKRAGLPFCYPEVSTQSKEVHARDSFDLALANKLVPENSTVVCNDFCLKGPERIPVVTGPNQGGKTTFARMFGQVHYLASLGLPVPGREAALFLPDSLFTHFEREEDLATLRGKLEDELVRIHDILQQATSNSILIMNESFSSTTLNDALFLGKVVMTRLLELDLLCVYVTFVDELATLSESTVSMVSMVVPENPALRTYKIERRPADGLAYAAAIAKKYGLTHESLTGRIAR